MEEKTITFEELKKEQRKREWKEKVRHNLKVTGDWIAANKEMATVIITGAFGLTGTAIKAINRHARMHKEEQLKDLYCYDRSLGHYWKLKRELSNSEWLEIDNRKKKGERLSDILEELKVLK